MPQYVNLGTVKAIFVGLNPPANKQVLWFDDNVGQKIHKYFDFTDNAWKPLRLQIGDNGHLLHTDIADWDEAVINTVDTVKGQPDGLVPLDDNGLIDKSFLPPVAYGQSFTVANEAAMVALPAQIGDVAIRTDYSPQVIFFCVGDATQVANWLPLNLPQTFASDFVVSLSGGKTFLKWTTGQTVPAAGKTPMQLMQEGAVEALAPTVSLTSSTTILFNQTAISNVLNFSYTINTLGGTVATVLLEWRRNNTGAWTSLDINTAHTTFTHTLTDTNFNTQPFNYRYTVTDNAGGTATVTKDITPGGYVAPTMSLTQVAAALNGTQTNALREIGNVSTNVSGSITRAAASANVNLMYYQLQYSVNGGGWTNLNGTVSIGAASGTIASTPHNDNTLKSSNTISYRVLVTDAFTTSTSSVVTITFQYLYLFGYSSNTSLSDAQAYGLGNGILATTRARTIVATAGVGLYTYITYPATFGNISQIIQDGATPVLGAFNGGSGTPTTQTVTNQYGVAATYNMYKSNQTNAFTSNTLVIS